MKRTAIKTGIDLVASITITNILNYEFWQNLIITLVVIIVNAFVIPCLRYLFTTLLNKMKVKGILSDEEFIKYCKAMNIQITEEDVKHLIEIYKEWKEKAK